MGLIDKIETSKNPFWMSFQLLIPPSVARRACIKRGTHKPVYMGLWAKICFSCGCTE